MHSVSISGASGAPPISSLRRSRILARMAASPALADVVAGLAFGADRRGDVVALASLTASRCGSSAIGGR